MVRDKVNRKLAAKQGKLKARREQDAHLAATLGYRITKKSLWRKANQERVRLERERLFDHGVKRHVAEHVMHSFLGGLPSVQELYKKLLTQHPRAI